MYRVIYSKRSDGAVMQVDKETFADAREFAFRVRCVGYDADIWEILPNGSVKLAEKSIYEILAGKTKP